VRGSPRLWLALVAAGPVVLAVGRLLPPHGPGLALRLAGAAACVLLLPGAFVVRALRPSFSIGVDLAAALAWSLVAVFLALAVTFAVAGTLSVTVALLGILMAAVFALSLRARAGRLARRELLAALGLTVLGAALAGTLWWATGTIGGSLGPTVSDALFHLARVRKLDDGGDLTSVGVVNDLAGADVHPGYAFPLWHGALALIARLGGVDPTLVVLYLPAILAPLSVLVAYGAGRALFRSWAGGVAVALGQLALVAFPHGGVGNLQFLAQPGGAARLLLVPGLLALLFTYVTDGQRGALAGAAASGFALAVVHPTYVVFVALVFAGFLLARALVADGLEGRRLAIGLAAMLVPAGLFSLWLLQFAEEAAAQRPQVRYAQQVETLSSGLHLRPEQLAWGGGTKVAALVAVPLALLAARRRWSALVLGGSLALFLPALVPPLFGRLSDLVSLSQAVRLAAFLPLPFALAGAAALAGRARAPGAVLALAAGIGVEVAYGEAATGAAWAVWLAALGAALGLVALTLIRPPPFDGGPPAGWAAAASVAFVLPVAVTGFADFERWNTPDPFGLSSGLVEELRRDARPLDVVLAPSVTSYRLAGYAPVRVVVAPPGHVAFSTREDYALRQRAAKRFFFAAATSTAERTAILRRYYAAWVVVDKDRSRPPMPPGLELVYADGRYSLYRVPEGLAVSPPRQEEG
jgi:hypothetical protein